MRERAAGLLLFKLQTLQHLLAPGNPTGTDSDRAAKPGALCAPQPMQRRDAGHVTQHGVLLRVTSPASAAASHLFRVPSSNEGLQCPVERSPRLLLPASAHASVANEVEVPLVPPELVLPPTASESYVTAAELFDDDNAGSAFGGVESDDDTDDSDEESGDEKDADWHPTATRRAIQHPLFALDKRPAGSDIAYGSVHPTAPFSSADSQPAGETGLALASSMLLKLSGSVTATTSSAAPPGNTTRACPGSPSRPRPPTVTRSPLSPCSPTKKACVRAA